jgi:hypothetical protein
VDPADFLSVAARFRSSLLEAERRTAVGRSYYGLYNILAGQPSTAGVLQGKGSDHERLIRHLHQNGDPALQKVCEKLKKLRTLRNRADYEMDGPIDAAHSELAYQWAREAVRILAGS